METVSQYREAAARVRAMAAESIHHSLRQRLLEMARELDQSADVRSDILHIRRRSNA